MNLVDTSKINFADYLEDISFTEAQSIRDTSSFIDDVLEYAEKGNQLVGTKLPWSNTHDYTRIGEGKLSIWAGESGAGKSNLLGQAMTHAMESANQKVVIASLEMKPKETIYRMICQSATCKASGKYSRAWLNRFNENLFIYDQLDTVAPDRILGMAHFAANELKANHIVIDSLTKCGLSRDDYSAQAKFVDRLQWCAKTWNVHIHLVCHMRKTDDGKKSGKSDIRGAAEITDLADNVYVVRRNKLKELHVELKNRKQDFSQEITEQPCVFLLLEKNRDYGFERTFGLFFDHPSGGYREFESQRVTPLELSL